MALKLSFKQKTVYWIQRWFQRAETCMFTAIILWGTKRLHSGANPFYNIHRWSFPCFQILIIHHVYRWHQSVFFSRKSVINILFENANDELEKISESFKANRLLLNWGKTKFTLNFDAPGLYQNIMVHLVYIKT